MLTGKMRTLKPGQPGTRQLYEKYGEDLVCVRYRYDKERMMCLKTVELVVDRKLWNPTKKTIPHNKIVCLHVAYGERDVGRIIR